MKILTNENNTIVIEEIYNNIILKSSKTNISVCEKDNGFEINLQNKTVRIIGDEVFLIENKNTYNYRNQHFHDLVNKINVNKIEGKLLVAVLTILITEIYTSKTTQEVFDLLHNNFDNENIVLLVVNDFFKSKNIVLDQSNIDTILFYNAMILLLTNKIIYEETVRNICSKIYNLQKELFNSIIEFTDGNGY
jgi:hypothetical protein